MAKEGQSGRLESITQAVRASGAGLPPVHLWNPPDCGDIDMRIGADGTWYYNKTPIVRPAMVRLFASILKREGDKHYLVTPVEKCGITVDDAPFLAVEVTQEATPTGATLKFRINHADDVVCGPDHRLRFERQPGHGGLKPYLHVRSNLWACVTRPVYYELADLGEERVIESVPWYGVISKGEFFAMAPVNELEDHGA